MNGISETQQSKEKWFIDKDWFRINNRSLSILSRGCLCPECLKRFNQDTRSVSDDKLIKSIKDCCSRTPGYISATTPILECVFRIILANGNTPLPLEDIMRQLGERWGVSIYRVSEPVLYTLLNNDRYYGLSRMED
jgi:hypothetical protein